VVLDWLLFVDPSAAPIVAAIESRRVRWIATAAMREELAEVLRRGLAASRGVDPRAVLAAWDEHAKLLPAPLGQPGASALQCTDADDQKFLDLARAEDARWLLSRDRAVLRLARRAAALGIGISVPERWSLPP